MQYTTPLVSEMRTSIAGNYRHIYKYEYDANGNITSITDNATFIVSYVYDGLNRLVRENNARDNTVTVYIYDNAGNITSKKLFDYTSYANTDTLTLKNSPHGKTVGYTYMPTGNKDRLLTYNGSEALSYDKHGNPQKWFKHGTTSQLKYSLMWEQVNRLTEITDKETNDKYEYTYNYQGIRTQKKVGDTEYKYYLDGKKIIQETRTTGSEVEKIQYYYGATGIVGFNYKGENYYFLKNIQVG